MNSMIATEDQEQIAFLEWCGLASRQHPELRWLFHIPNGGSRHVLEAIKLKKMGVKPGVPDLFLPVPRAGWHGWFCEMKSRKGRRTDAQKDWGLALYNFGYAYHVAYGWEEAKNQVLLYLRGAIPREGYGSGNSSTCPGVLRRKSGRTLLMP
jgi:hypothetical protein